MKGNGKESCISVYALYSKYGNTLAHCTISVEDEGYYDLQTPGAGTVCMDGETCEAISDDGKVVTLINREGELDCDFKLTKEEFEVACFCN